MRQEPFYPTEKQLCTMKSLYLDGKPYNEISSELGLTKDQIYYVLKKNGAIQKRNILYPTNKNIFTSIDTQEKAYFLGLFHADGYNDVKRGKIEISLQEEDGYILKNISSLFFGDRPLQNRPPGKKGKKNMHKLYVPIRKISEDLLSFGCIQDKTVNLKFPNLQKELIRHYIRGMFDGDGCFKIKKNQRNYINGEFSIISTKEWHEKAKFHIQKLTGVRPRVSISKYTNFNLYNTCIYSQEDILSIYNFLYKDANIFLNRKKLKMEDFFSQVQGGGLIAPK
jgi:hypothetical protein